MKSSLITKILPALLASSMCIASTGFALIENDPCDGAVNEIHRKVIQQGKPQRLNLIQSVKILPGSTANTQQAKVTLSNFTVFTLDPLPRNAFRSLNQWVSGDFLKVAPGAVLGTFSVSNITHPSLAFAFTVSGTPTTAYYVIKSVSLGNDTSLASVTFFDDSVYNVTDDQISILQHWATGHHVLFDIVEEGFLHSGILLLSEKYRVMNIETGSTLLITP